MIKKSIKMKTKEKISQLVEIISRLPGQNSFGAESILYIKNEKRTRRAKPRTLEMSTLVSETEPLAEISAAPMSKLSRLRTNLKKIRWHDLL